MNNYTWELNQFDTDHFGFKTAKITNIIPVDETLPSAVKDLIEELKQNEVTYATYRLPANQFNVIHELEKNGFTLVDGLISLKAELTTVEDLTVDEKIATAQPSDADQLMNLARNVFSLTRFFNDPFIDLQKAKELYAKWVENSLKGEAADEVLVYEENYAILGFATIQYKGRIPLIGVDTQAQGRGIAKKLVKAALAKLQEKEVKEVEIETQLINTAALRAYMACGFKITDSHLTFSWHS